MNKLANWLELMLGAWIVVSPWVLDFAQIIPAFWSCTLSGVLIAVLTSRELFGGEKTTKPLAQNVQYTTEV